MKAFNEGCNEEKRKVRAIATRERAEQVRIYRESEIGPRRAPKNNCAAMIEMLSDRALRQRRGEHALIRLRAKKRPSKYEPHQGAQEIARRAARG